MASLNFASPGPAALTATDLLGIPANEPERLFAPDRAAVDRAYRALAAIWHPDRNATAPAIPVFQHLTALREAALARLADGEWHEPGRLTLTGRDGRAWRLRHRRRRAFELGDLYVAGSVAAWLVDPAHADLVDRAVRQIGTFRFGDDAMRGAISRYLPVMAHQVDTKRRRAVVVHKPADMILLADLLEHVGGRLDPRHVAWILSELYCFACWMAWAGLTHNALAADTLFVSPEHHAVAVLGGWWYATPAGARLAALSARSAALAAADIIRRKIADFRLDLDLIRALGRDLLGDAPGVPAALATWLALASNGSAQDDYAQWQQVLTDAFGSRRFTPLNVRPEDVYR
ncbi:MAG TPA: J domain-containing protein [Vineibacter sp.]|nr:J domain-containing protein [Vineibacter sp.]